jgi:hypothetical protein
LHLHPAVGGPDDAPAHGPAADRRKQRSREQGPTARTAGHRLLGIERSGQPGGQTITAGGGDDLPERVAQVSMIGSASLTHASMIRSASLAHAAVAIRVR